MLRLDIASPQLNQLILDLAATEKQVKLALRRATVRTVASLRTMAGRNLRNDLHLRAINLLRKRMKSQAVRMNGGGGFELWFGLNEMPASWFKGRPRQTAAGAVHGGTEFPGAFVGRARSSRKEMVFKRKGASRLKIEEQLKEVEPTAAETIEQKVFSEAEEIFWKHFERDLRARVNYQLGGA